MEHTANLVISRTEEFKNIFEAIDNLTDIITLDITKQQLQFIDTDTSRVCLIKLEIFPSFFETYNIETQKNQQACISLTVKVSSLCKILKTLNIKDNWTITCSSTNFVIQDNCRTYSLVVLETEKEVYEIPEMEYNLSVDLPSDQVIKVIRDICIHSPEDIKFEYEKHLTWSTSSDQGNCSYMWKNSLDNDKDVETFFSSLDLNGNSHCLIYSPAYITKICKTKVTSTLNVSLSSHFPTRFSYSCQEFNLEFFLASKIIEDY